MNHYDPVITPYYHPLKVNCHHYTLFISLLRSCYPIIITGRSTSHGFAMSTAALAANPREQPFKAATEGRRSSKGETNAGGDAVWG